MHGRHMLVLAAIALSMVDPLAAQDEIKPFNRRIVGGEKADIKNHLWQVALDINKIDGQFLCGGSIIAERWVLTAAHCFGKSIDAKNVRAKAGATNFVVSGAWSDIEAVIIHDAYNAETNENDIALVRLKSPATGRVIPLAKPALPITANQPLEVAGWGATAEDGATSRSLRKAIVPYVEHGVCNEPSSYNGAVKPSMLCAGYRAGGVDSCQGDSGGPLVWRTPDGPVLVGVVSFGTGCARKLKYGVYTRVSAYRGWIDRVVGLDRR